MIKHVKKIFAVLAGMVCILLFFLSCSQNNPNINEGYIGLCYYDNSGNIEERYYLFVVPSDDDGLEDIDELNIFHKKEGLRWRLSSADWLSVDADGKTWIGTRSLSMQNGEELPRGVFTAETVDKAGMTGRIELTFDVREVPHPFPVFSIEDGTYTIISEYPVHHFICYSGNGAFIQTVRLESLNGELSALSLPRETRSLALWAESPEIFVSALTEMKNIN